MKKVGPAMVVIEDAWRQGESRGPGIVTIGNFDGIHTGQQAILQKVVDRASASGLDSVMVTFEPHPQSVLRPDRPPPRLTTRGQKRALVDRWGLDAMAEVEFDDEFANTTAREFVRRLLHERLQALEVYVGSRFAFGRRREGDLDLLRELGETFGFEAFGIEEVVFGDAPVSSTRIRRAIRAGEVADANLMLGRPYSIYGVVERGDGRGKKLGWPTINVATAHEVVPQDGVYASRVWLPGVNRLVGAVTNVGSRPTFPDSDQKVVESHLFDFDREVYGEDVELCFLERLREEQTFPSAEALGRQIEKDAERAREYLQRESCLEFMPTLAD